jgi:hypothetical protein
LGSGYLILRGLEHSIASQTNLTRLLQDERATLQQRVDEQTAYLRREIEDRIKTEVVLSASECRFRQLFEASIIPIALIRDECF